ncbi:uncharacterized protein METZ01_LOCUS242163, partial [marine metagenome]
MRKIIIYKTIIILLLYLLGCGPDRGTPRSNQNTPL